MRHLPLILIILLSFSSCKSSKLAKKRNSISVSETSNKSSTKPFLAQNIINNAIIFSGTGYKYGGITKKGMDCSGLVYVAFKKEDIILPRVSQDMAKKGKRITLQQAKKGDLLFFKTNKNRKVINHVGLIVKSNNGSIEFIHSTTSKGVITSSLSETYWKLVFIEVRRIL